MSIEQIRCPTKEHVDKPVGGNSEVSYKQAQGFA